MTGLFMAVAGAQLLAVGWMLLTGRLVTRRSLEETQLRLSMWRDTAELAVAQVETLKGALETRNIDVPPLPVIPVPRYEPEDTCVCDSCGRADGRHFPSCTYGASL